MTLLLKQLQIHGFKSFATPTTFAFDRGITAVIGPNGSGKSNVAEALRWVLGEQAGASLRSRRTEDVIFAGSDKRAQLAMAEVILTLDNSDGDLPLPFSEITVSRRAFRSGENQYLINGSRVRLKDVQQLVAPLGQSYTIIGQGLVDAALSQRPEERRGLFEHAAGISGLRLRANEAERSLNEALGNAQRLRDILSELEPRVKSLERQARLAREYGAVREQLTALHLRYYGTLWRELSERLNAARESLRDADTRHQAAERTWTEHSQRLSGLRGQERALVDASRQLQETLATHERALAERRHARELSEQRARANEQRVSDLRGNIRELEEERDGVLTDTERTAATREELSGQITRLEGELRAQELTLADARERRAQLQARIADAERRRRELLQEIARIDGALHAAEERQSAIEREMIDLASADQASQEQLAEVEAAITERHDERAELETRLECDERARQLVEATIRDARERLTAMQPELEQAERELARATARFELLERAHLNGEGLYSGVRAVLRAVRKGELALPGLLGTLAESIEVPNEYETAIEVALGGHLQDIIVERWSDAQAAIDFLKRANAGRATFQPLDTVRPARPLALDARDEAIFGIASQLVSFDSAVAPVIEQVLGRTLVVTDLDAARRVVRMTTGWTVVTLAGEITRPTGAVTGGSRVQDAGMLARERERRTLPRVIDEQRDAVAGLQAERERITADAGRAATEVASRRDEIEQQQRALRAIEHEIERLERDRQARERERASADTRRRDVEQRQQQVAEQIESLRSRRTAAQADIERIDHELGEVNAMTVETPEDLTAHAADLRSALAAARERLAGLDAQYNRSRQRGETIQRLLVARQADIDAIRASTDGAHDGQAALDAEIVELERQLAGDRSRLGPLDREREETVASVTVAERDLNRVSEQLREAERERDRATLALARVQDEQVFVQERIRNDLDLEDPGQLNTDDDGPVPTDAEIARVRERLRRMSVVSEDVLEQFDTESERLGYLTQQLADVDAAADGLRKVLAELNASMATRFSETFRDVAVMFEQTFTRLFGGGTARLVMNSAEDGATGIDIVAQPPGKRLQNLNALSGGERTLTAVALLIAIQRVNPSPFCLLDEVDAALDESNVVRFRDELRELAATTQFVVITHNRGTIEGADTLYGVTMGDDGVSRVLSLRLDEAIRAVDEFATAQTADG